MQKLFVRLLQPMQRQHLKRLSHRNCKECFQLSQLKKMANLKQQRTRIWKSRLTLRNPWKILQICRQRNLATKRMKMTAQKTECLKTKSMKMTTWKNQWKTHLQWAKAKKLKKMKILKKMKTYPLKMNYLLKKMKKRMKMTNLILKQ